MIYYPLGLSNIPKPLCPKKMIRINIYSILLIHQTMQMYTMYFQSDYLFCLAWIYHVIHHVSILHSIFRIFNARPNSFRNVTSTRAEIANFQAWFHCEFNLVFYIASRSLSIHFHSICSLKIWLLCVQLK
jgi:hypothetical protein